MITLEALERRNNLGFSIVAGSAVSGLLYIGFSFYGSLYTDFYCLTCFAYLVKPLVKTLESASRAKAALYIRLGGGSAYSLVYDQ